VELTKEANQLKDDLEYSLQRELVLADELQKAEGTHIITNYQSRSRLEQELEKKQAHIRRLEQ